ncbi:MAG: hypothetical protein WBA93_31640, partial [Microcoleaceae cyanobacterium]
PLTQQTRFMTLDSKLKESLNLNPVSSSNPIETQQTQQTRFMTLDSELKESLNINPVSSSNPIETQKPGL